MKQKGHDIPSNLSILRLCALLFYPVFLDNFQGSEDAWQ
jgi:hypothetical protein